MAEGARLESVYTATYRGFESPPHRHIQRRARTKVRAFFSHFICLYGSEHGGRVEYVTCEFLSCLYGSERVRKGFTAPRRFLSCLYGSELKYYTFSPLLIKQNHPILLQHPFLSLPSRSTNYQQLTIIIKKRV